MNVFQTLCPWLFEPLEMLESAALAERLGHGWLISGAGGVGKRNLAYVLADRLLRRSAGEPRPEPATARECLAVYSRLGETLDLHPDLHRIRPEDDKRTISVDQIREMISDIALTPHVAGAKLVVIESAEAMTTAAANALLKSLEEPTPNTYLLLLAERTGRLPATIRSRCQHLPLKAPTAASTVEWLRQDGLATDDLPRALISRSPLNAARLAEQEDNKNNELLDSINLLYRGQGNAHAMAHAWNRDDPENALGCLADSLRSRIRQHLVPDRWTPITDSEAPLADNNAIHVSVEALFDSLELAENLRDQIGRGVNVELALEALLLGLTPSQDNRVYQ